MMNHVPISARDTVALRDVIADDLPIFFAYQLDADANHMAAFTTKDPTDRNAFDAHWAKVLSDDTITVKAILFKGAIAGHIARHAWFGEPEVTYWVGRESWGKGIATVALSAFLIRVTERPLAVRVAKDNVASLRVLQKCGFIMTGEDKGFANARDEEIAEFVLRLSG